MALGEPAQEPAAEAIQCGQYEPGEIPVLELKGEEVERVVEDPSGGPQDEFGDLPPDVFRRARDAQYGYRADVRQPGARYGDFGVSVFRFHDNRCRFKAVVAQRDRFRALWVNSDEWFQRNRGAATVEKVGERQRVELKAPGIGTAILAGDLHKVAGGYGHFVSLGIQSNPRGTEIK
jgi:hypothetical protein